MQITAFLTYTNVQDYFKVSFSAVSIPPLVLIFKGSVKRKSEIFSICVHISKLKGIKIIVVVLFYNFRTLIHFNVPFYKWLYLIKALFPQPRQMNQGCVYLSYLAEVGRQQRVWGSNRLFRRHNSNEHVWDYGLHPQFPQLVNENNNGNNLWNCYGDWTKSI